MKSKYATILRQRNNGDRPDDYVIRCDGQDVGRIYRTLVPDGEQWRWMIYGSSSGGLESSLADAKVVWRKAFEVAAN